MTLKDVKYFSTLPDEAISIYEKAYSEKLNIDDDNWQEAKEIEQLRIGKDYPGI